MNFGNKILELRKQKGVTQEELAAELGVTAAAVSKWENGYTLPDILMLCALADFFAVTTDELLGRTSKTKYAVMAAETPELGRRAAKLAETYGLAVRSIHTNFEEATAAVATDDTVQYLVACYLRSGYYGCPNVTNLVSVAPTERDVLEGIRRVYENHLKD